MKKYTSVNSGKYADMFWRHFLVLKYSPTKKLFTFTQMVVLIMDENKPSYMLILKSHIPQYSVLIVSLIGVSGK